MRPKVAHDAKCGIMAHKSHRLFDKTKTGVLDMDAERVRMR